MVTSLPVMSEGRGVVYAHHFLCHGRGVTDITSSDQGGEVCSKDVTSSNMVGSWLADTIFNHMAKQVWQDHCTSSNVGVWLNM